MLLVTFATLALSVKLYLDVPKGFFPLEDTGFIRGISEAAADTSFQAMAARQQALADVIRKDPAVDYLHLGDRFQRPSTRASSSSRSSRAPSVIAYSR